MKEMGRPTIEINMEELEIFMRWNPSRSDTAAFFKVSEDTLARRIMEKTGLTFMQFREQNMVHTRRSLINEALARSSKSDTILIFCLKNLCKWGDKNELPQEDDRDLDAAEETARKIENPRSRVSER